MENAILMASGLGTRMYPLTEKIPKPLIKVLDKPMIETVIEGLLYRGVDNIYVVVGYLGEQFSYLEDKYVNVTLIENGYYERINNISSVYVARDILLKGDCFICEADLCVLDRDIFRKNLDSSGYYGKIKKGFSDDWVFEQNEEGIITRVGKNGTDCYNMTGVAFFKDSDAKKLFSLIEVEFGKEGYEELFWDDVVNKYIKEFSLVIYPVNDKQIVEIDTVKELECVRTELLK